MTMFTFWTDFNDIEGDTGCTSMLLTHGGVMVANTIKVGDLVGLVDEDGNRCVAVVTNVEMPMIDYRIDWDTFQPATKLDGDLSYGFVAASFKVTSRATNRPRSMSGHDDDRDDDLTLAP